MKFFGNQHEHAGSIAIWQAPLNVLSKLLPIVVYVDGDEHLYTYDINFIMSNNHVKPLLNIIKPTSSFATDNNALCLFQFQFTCGEIYINIDGIKQNNNRWEVVGPQSMWTEKNQSFDQMYYPSIKGNFLWIKCANTFKQHSDVYKVFSDMFNHGVVY